MSLYIRLLLFDLKKVIDSLRNFERDPIILFLKSMKAKSFSSNIGSYPG